MNTEVLIDGLPIHSIRRAHRRQRVTRGILGEQRQSCSFHPFTHRVGQLPLPRKHLIESLGLHDSKHFLKADDQGHRRCKQRLILGLVLALFLKVKIKRCVLGFLRKRPSLVADAHKCHARRKHQRLLRTGNDNVQAPCIRLDIEYTQCGNRIDDQYCILVPFDNLAQCFHVMRHSGRRLTGLDIDRLN